MGRRFVAYVIAAIICTQAVFTVNADNSTSGSNSSSSSNTTTTTTAAVTTTKASGPIYVDLNITSVPSTSYNLATGANIVFWENKTAVSSVVLDATNATATFSWPSYTTAQKGSYNLMDRLSWATNPLYIAFSGSVSTHATLAWNLDYGSNLSSTAYNKSSQAWYSYSNGTWTSTNSYASSLSGANMVFLSETPITGTEAYFGVLVAANTTGTKQTLPAKGSTTPVVFTIPAGVAPQITLNDPSTGQPVLRISSLNGNGGTVSVTYADASSAQSSAIPSDSLLQSDVFEISYSGTLAEPVNLVYALKKTYDSTKDYSWKTFDGDSWENLDGSTSAVVYDNTQNVWTVVTTVPHFSPWATFADEPKTTTSTTKAPTASSAATFAPLTALMALAWVLIH